MAKKICPVCNSTDVHGFTFRSIYGSFWAINENKELNNNEKPYFLEGYYCNGCKNPIHIEETINYDSEKAQMIYLALLYVLRNEKIPFDEKHDLFGDQLTSLNFDAVHLVDLLDGLHDFIKLTTAYEY